MIFVAHKWEIAPLVKAIRPDMLKNVSSVTSFRHTVAVSARCCSQMSLKACVSETALLSTCTWSSPSVTLGNYLCVFVW